MDELQNVFVDKDGICKIFGVKKKTLNNDLTEMRRTGDFKKYIRHPSQCRTLVHIKGYDEFLLYKQELYESKM